MKETVRQIFLFLLPILLVWAGFYLYFEKKIKYQAYPIFKIDEAMEAAPDHFDYLIGGHSRLNRAIDTELLLSSIKATSHGESPIETYYKLKYILENTEKKFHTLLLPFEAGTFKPNDFRRSIYWVKYVDFFEVGYRKGELSRYIMAWLEARFLPFLPYYKKKFKALFPDKEKEIRIDKINGRFSELPENEQRVLIQEDVDFLNAVGMVDETTKHYVQKTILLGQKYDIQVIYIKSPLTKAYSEELLGLDKNSSISHDELEVFVRSFDHVRILDMEAIFWQQDSLFSDHHHLNIVGRAVFTNRLLERLQKREQ